MADKYVEGKRLKLKCSYCTYKALRFFFEDVFRQFAEFEEQNGDEYAFTAMSSKVQAYLHKQTAQELFGLVHAARYLKCGVIMRFLSKKSGLLHQAAECGQAEVLQALIEAKCEVNVQVSMGKTMCTALELASNERCESLLIAAGAWKASSSVEKSVMAQILVPKAAAAGKKEPLSDAMKTSIQRGQVTAVQELLDRKAIVNAMDVDGDTALHHAVQADFRLMVEYLLSRKADVSIANNKGVKPIQLASDEVRQLLHWRRFNPDIPVGFKGAERQGAASSCPP